jgi:hypothetical protein
LEVKREEQLQTQTGCVPLINSLLCASVKPSEVCALPFWGHCLFFVFNQNDFLGDCSTEERCARFSTIPLHPD